MYAPQTLDHDTSSYFGPAPAPRPDEADLPLPDSDYAGIAGPIDPAGAVQAFGHLASTSPSTSPSAAAPAPADFGARPTAPGQDHAFLDWDWGNGGLEAGASLAGSAEALANNLFGVSAHDDLFSAHANAGLWQTAGGDSRVGARGDLSLLPRQDGIPLSGIPLVGGALQRMAPEGSLGIDAPALTAEASVGTDGLTVGAGVTGVAGAATFGEFGTPGDEWENQLRVGFGATLGAAGRLHWGDEDGDGWHEVGIGFDAGLWSADFKSEAIHQGLDWSAEKLGEGLEWLFAPDPDQGLEPLPAPVGPPAPELGFGN